jgi:hypothetical protein
MYVVGSGVPSLGVKKLVHEADRSYSSAEIKDVCGAISTLLHTPACFSAQLSTRDDLTCSTLFVNWATGL